MLFPILFDVHKSTSLSRYVCVCVCILTCIYEEREKEVSSSIIHRTYLLDLIGKIFYDKIKIFIEIASFSFKDIITDYIEHNLSFIANIALAIMI